MNWAEFFRWLEANNVKYFSGDIHYAGRGYWFPMAPELDGDEDPLPPEPWLRVQRDQADPHIVYISTSYGRNILAESPSDAREAVEKVLMEMDTLMGAEALTLPRHIDHTTEDQPTRRGRPMDNTRADAMRKVRGGRYLPRVPSVWEENLTKGLEAQRRLIKERELETHKTSASSVYKGEALKMRGYDDDVTDLCDQGHHARCRGCGCGCHLSSRTFKSCTGCGRGYTRAQWDKLPLLGKQKLEAEGNDAACIYVAKNCSCTGTMYVAEDV